MSIKKYTKLRSSCLHVLVTGLSGKGKSHTFDTMVKMSPKDQRFGGMMSDKALFYTDDLSEGSIICLDDVEVSDAMQEILKGITTSFQNEFIYRTVDKDRTGVKKIIPKRGIWWVAKMEGTGDDQVWNRIVIRKLTADVKIPFKLQGDIDIRIEETRVHEALREALVNTIIHADYSGTGSILVMKRPISLN